MDRMSALDFSRAETARQARDWYAETLRELDVYGDTPETELVELGVDGL